MLYLVECFFWKDSWINEEPSRRLYGNKEDCISFLETEKIENEKYGASLNYEEMELSYSTDERRHYLLRIVEIKPVGSHAA